MEKSTEQSFSSAIVGSGTNKQKFKIDEFSEYREERYFANVWVQLLLYLNVHFCGIWLISSVITFYYEYWNLSTIHRVLSILSLTIAAPVECLRLYLGYSGNLLDKIPDFAGFWILSVFIQTPLQVSQLDGYLGYLLTSDQILKYKTSTVFQSIQCLLLFLQIVSSFTAIRRASRFRREQFQSEKVAYSDTRHQRQQVPNMGSSVSVISD